MCPSYRQKLKAVVGSAPEEMAGAGLGPGVSSVNSFHSALFLGIN